MDASSGSKPRQTRRRAWPPAWLIGLVAATVGALGVAWTIGSFYRLGSLEQRTEVIATSLEGLGWGLFVTLGSGLQGEPTAMLEARLALIEGDITEAFNEIRALGTESSVESFLRQFEQVHADVRSNFSLLLSGDRQSAAEAFSLKLQPFFAEFLTTSARTRQELAQSAAAAERRGGAATALVLVLTSVIVVVLSVKVSGLRRRRAVENAQDRVRQRFQNLITKAPDMISVWNADGECIYDSPAVERLLGWSPDQRIGTRGANILHPCDLKRIEPTLAELAEHPGESRAWEIRVRHADETWHWIESTVTNLCDDPAVNGFVANYRIIDDRKHAEEIRQQLMTRLIEAQEDERRRIAADIHDDSVQVMTAVQLRLATLSRAASETERTHALRYLDETVRLSIMRLRRLLFELRPASLDREGLTQALAAHLELLEEETGIECAIQSSLEHEPPLRTRVVLYRIAQEALANVRKHSGAAHGRIDLSDNDGGFLIRIADDGIGFDPSEETKAGHLGLVAMRERAEDLSGWVGIESTPGRGTIVSIWAAADAALDEHEPAPTGVA